MDLGGGEQVRGDEPPRPAPVLAIGHKGNVDVAAEESVGHAGGEEVVVRAEDGLSGARGGDDEVAHQGTWP